MERVITAFEGENTRGDGCGSNYNNFRDEFQWSLVITVRKSITQNCPSRSAQGSKEREREKSRPIDGTLNLFSAINRIAGKWICNDIYRNEADRGELTVAENSKRNKTEERAANLKFLLFKIPRNSRETISETIVGIRKLTVKIEAIGRLVYGGIIIKAWRERSRAHVESGAARHKFAADERAKPSSLRRAIDHGG